MSVIAVADGRAPSATDDGYASCPLTTSRHSVLLAELDHTMRPHPTIPIINSTCPDAL